MTNEYYKSGKHKYMDYGDEMFADYIYKILNNTISLLQKKKETAYEIGAGMGRFSAPIIEDYDNTILIEPSKDYYLLLKERFKSADADIFNLTFTDFNKNNKITENSTVFGFHILHHLKYAQRKEVYSSIKDSKSIGVFVEPNPYNPLLPIQLVLNPDMKISEEKQCLKLTHSVIRNELKELGIDIIKYERICCMPPFITNFMLHNGMENILLKTEKINRKLPIIGSYHVFYVKGE